MGKFLSIMRHFLTLLFRVFSTFVSYQNSTIYKISKDDRLIDSSSKSCKKHIFPGNFFLVELLSKTFSHAFSLRLYPNQKGIVNYPMVSFSNLKNDILLPEKTPEWTDNVWKIPKGMLFTYVYIFHSTFRLTV